MVFKINLGTSSGQTFKLEAEANGLIDKKLNEKIDGKVISPDLEGYELEIKGASDKSGFTALDSVEGIGRKKVLLSYEKGMKTRPKYEGKKKRSDAKPKGLRLRKTVRGNTISEEIVQVNLKILKEGKKKLSEIFPDQNKAPESESSKEAENSEEKKE
jgi:small subunit ribosomal protein S6e